MGHLTQPSTGCPISNTMFPPEESDGIHEVLGNVKHIGESASHICLPKQGNPWEARDGRLR